VGRFLRDALATVRALRPLSRWRTPAPGGVDFGDLRSLEPISRHWGFDRGRPVDRYYIEAFLARNADAIRGRVLEVGDDAYTRRFGGARVTRRDVLHVSGTAPEATIVADLTDAPHVESDAFDCIILTQTLQLVFDVRAALRTLHRILRPGGVLLLTVPGITPTTDAEWRSSWYWSFTTTSLGRLAADEFPEGSFAVDARGNVLAATAFVQGIAHQELTVAELDHYDPDYPVTVTLRAVKPASRP
jgi:SAM-dependent methyltransferase